MHSKQKILKQQNARMGKAMAFPILSPKLENCNKMSKKYPNSFGIPSKAQLDALRVGEFAKVIAPGERFWVIIRERKENDFVGEINNHLVGTDLHKLKYGDLIAFKRDNICDIDRM